MEINTAGNYTITGNTTSNAITVNGGDVTITLKGVSVTSSGCAFDIQSGDVTLILANGSENTFESGSYYAGIHVAEDASLTIKGNGTLKAVSKEVPGARTPHDKTIGAGIGGNGEIGGPDANGNGQDTGDNAGAITIESGTICATSEGDGAGIGGGWTMETGGVHGSFSSITINGGTVKAESMNNGAGIGCGCWAKAMGDITITGGEVHARSATSAGRAYDIGYAHKSSGFSSTVTVTGGVVFTEGSHGRGIGAQTKEQDDAIIFSSNGYGEVYGDATLDSDLTIESGQTLYIPEGSSLTVSKDCTLTVEDNATLENDGVLNNQGTVEVDGTVTGSGKFDGNPITIGYNVSVTVPTFESVREKYTQPEAKAITIQNEGTKSVTISSVTVNNKDFTVEPAGSTSVVVQPGQTDVRYKIRPEAGLPGGLHTATVTVAYNDCREVEAEVSFMVHPFAAGEGTLESPYQIRDLEELEKFRDFINNRQNGGGEGMYFKLMSDINLDSSTEDPWTPIGDGNTMFMGTFDGGGHTIRGLHIDSTSGIGMAGLFGLNGGTISNLNVSGSVSGGGESFAGMIVVMNMGTVTGCSSAGSVAAEDSTGSAYDAGGIVGGVVGVNMGVVKDCNSTAHVAVTVVGGSETFDVMCGAGGIVGVTADASVIQPTVKNCAFSGKVTGSVSGGITTQMIVAGIGGVVGMNMPLNGSGATITVEGCSNSGAVSGSGSCETMTDAMTDAMTGVCGIMGLNIAVDGTTFVKNCLNTGMVSDDISGSNNGVGGIVGTNLSTDSKNATVENCCNTGDITGTSRIGGIVGNNSGSTVTNCYYLDTATSGVGYGDSTGTTEKTETEFASGEVAYLLQGAQDDQVWGQTMGSDTPELTGETSKKVYKITGNVDGQNDVVWYTNSNATLPDAAPSKSGFTFAGWSTKANGPVDFESGTPVTADTTVYAVWKPDLEGSGTQDAPYLIPDKAALEVFREYVNSGKGADEYFKLTADIDLGGVEWTPIGSTGREFQGTFDGDNFTVSGLSISTSTGMSVGLFGCLGESGTVKNLTVEGNITGMSSVGGIVGQNNGGTINGCHNAAAVTSSETAGGIVGLSNGIVTNCYNTGAVTGTGGSNFGGIVGHVTRGSVTNCYNTANVTGNYGDYSVGGIVGFNSSCTVTNCYFLSGTATSGIGGDGEATEKTAAQFASGQVAHLLQGGQETPVWGQTLPSDTYPVLTSDPAKAVHTVTFHLGGSEDGVMYYVNSSGLTELPAAPEKTGFTFAGWSTAEDGPVDFESGTPVTADVTLYPIYETTPSADAALRGKVTEEGGLPVAGASVTLRQGGKDVQTAETGGGGSYFFEDVEPGIYEVVVEAGGKTMTTMVTVPEEAGTEKNLTMPDENVSSKLQVKGEDPPAVVVGGLDKEALDSAKSDPGKAVTVTMTVEAVTDGAAESDVQDSIDAIKTESTSSGHEYLDLTLERTVSEAGKDETTEIPVTQNLITVVIPFDPSGKSSIVVYRYHGGEVDTLSETGNIDGEHIVVDDKAVTVYAKKFSTYAIGYTVQTAPTSYAITVPQTEHGTLTADRRSAIRGRAVTLTATPDEGCHLASLTVTDRRGKPVELTDNGDGTYTFTQPSGRVTIAAQFVPCSTLGYADLDAGAWYHDCTDYVITNALMRGVADGIFDPDGAVTRAQMVTVLWNMRGDPVVNYYMTYADVSEESWYAEAVRWAASEGIASGYGGLFRPNDPVTREELAVMLYRYERKFGSGGFTGQWSYRLPFTDLEEISDWAYEAVAWCSMKGVVLGRDNTVFDPSGPATRAELAAILTRYGQTPSAQ